MCDLQKGRSRTTCFELLPTFQFYRVVESGHKKKIPVFAFYEMRQLVFASIQPFVIASRESRYGSLSEVKDAKIPLARNGTALLPFNAGPHTTTVDEVLRTGVCSAQ